MLLCYFATFTLFHILSVSIQHCIMFVSCLYHDDDDDDDLFPVQYLQIMLKFNFEFSLKKCVTHYGALEGGLFPISSADLRESR